MTLSTKELLRYSRHLNLPKFGLATQEKLKAAKVLVVGTGGLGAPMLQYLTAAGIGTIGVVDFDIVDESNLQRQVLFTTKDLKKPKTKTAIARLRDQNPHVNFVEHNLKLDASNALDIIRDYEVVADGTDNFQTRYLVNDACVLLGKTNVYASIFQYEGQVSVFNYGREGEEKGPNYRDLFPTPPPPGLVPSCAEGGVLGVLPGIIGSLQASEVIKVVTGIGKPLSGRLFLFDALEFSSRTLNVSKDETNPLSGSQPTQTGLIDYDEFCGLNEVSLVNAISVEELKVWMEEQRDFQLIDVREVYEYESANLSGDLIPLSKLENEYLKISKEKEVVIHCKSGGRSQKAIELLSSKYGYSNLLNLEGGILAWRDLLEPNMVVL